MNDVVNLEMIRYGAANQFQMLRVRQLPWHNPLRTPGKVASFGQP